MTATIHVPSHNISEPCEDDGKALHCAVILRALFPGLDVVIEFSNSPARDGEVVTQDAGAPAPRSSYESVTSGDIDLEIPGFLRRPFKPAS